MLTVVGLNVEYVKMAAFVEKMDSGSTPILAIGRSVTRHATNPGDSKSPRKTTSGRVALFSQITGLKY